MTYLFSAVFLFASLKLSSCAAQPKAEVAGSAVCQKRDWQEMKFEILGHSRRLLYKGSREAWKKGSIIVLHGGGGKPEDFCDPSSRLIIPQVKFAEMAVEEGFGVFLLDSTRIVADNDGKICGKVWDDEVRARENLDLPYLKHILEKIVPAQRPKGSNDKIFLVGHSSGGYMTARAASHMGHLFNGFALMASGDPYGWARKCDPKYGDKRDQVKGAGFDNETGQQIIEINSCQSDSYPNEKTWDQYPGVKPKFRVFHNDFDGINDRSCSRKIEKQLRAHGFTGPEAYLAKNHDGQRRLLYHFWANEYNSEILNFFKSYSRP